MILDIGTIKEGHSTIHQLSDLESVRDDLPPLSQKVIGDMSIDRSAANVYVQVQFLCGLELECARCLSKYQQNITGNFRLILQEKEGHYGPAQGDETADFYFDASHTLVDISPFIFDEIMISLPLKPLCKTDCKGITLEMVEKKTVEPVCDPRWEALRILKDKYK